MLQSPTCSPRKKKLCRRIIDLRHRISDKNKQIKRIQSKNRYLKKKVASLKTILTELESKNLLDAENVGILSRLGVGQRELIQRQDIKSRTGTIVRKRYSPQLKSFALTLNFYSSKAYQYVRKTFNTCLPSLRTLAKWYQCIDGRPGFTKESFNALKVKTDQAKSVIHASLIIDEMKLKNKVEFHPASQRVFGYVDYGTGIEDSDCKDECTDALVFLVVPINSRFKVPIGYFLISGMKGEQKATLVLQAISMCHDVKVNIVAVTFDGCPANLTMAKKLGCNLDPKNLKTAFKHPETGANVVIWPDPCHMLKLIRNAFHFYKELVTKSGKYIKWQYLEELHKLQELENFHMANKLRASHINFKDNIMKVKLATQLFSRSVAKALQFLCQILEMEEFRNVDETVNMLLLLNDTFDILDSNVHGRGLKRALNTENHEIYFRRLDEAKDFFMSITTNNVKNKFTPVKLIDSPRFTGFLGMCIVIESTKTLYTDLINNEQIPITYLPLHKLSQDHIELFFCNVRSHGGCNNNPTPRLFETIYKRILVHTELMDIGTGNCMPLENISILNCSTPIERINITTPGYHSQDTEPNDDEKTNMEPDLDILAMSLSRFSENMVEYIAGFVVSSLVKKLKCSICIQALVSLNENKNSFIYYRDLGGLIYPSKTVTKICKRSEMTVKTYLYNDETQPMNVTKLRAEFLTAQTLKTFIGEQLFADFAYHQFDTMETNHIIDLTKCVIKKYIDTRLSYLIKSKSKQKVVRRVYTKLIHFKNQ